MRFAFVAAVFVYMYIGYKQGQGPLMPWADSRSLVIGLTVTDAIMVALVPLLTMRMVGLPKLVLKLAVYEAGAVFGLVLSFLTHDPHYAVLFGLPALVLLLLA
jgi:hypothetical protein